MTEPTWNLINTTFNGDKGGFDTGTLVTEDGRDCLKLVVSDGISNNPASFEGNFTMEFVAKFVYTPDEPEVGDTAYVYISTIADSSNYGGILRFYNNSSFGTNLFYSRSQPYAAETPVVRRVLDIDSTSWNTVRWISDNYAQTLYVNHSLIHTGLVTNDYAGLFLPGVWLDAYVSGNSDVVCYYDSYKLSSSVAYYDDADLTRLRFDGVTDLYTRPAQLGTASPFDSTWTEESKFKIALGKYNSPVYEVPVVATTDGNASKVRFYDGSAVKSLMKLPI